LGLLSFSKGGKRMKRTLIVVALAAAFPLSALAQSTYPSAPAKEKGPSLNTFDKDKDGYVSREEAKSSRELSSRFGELDKDNDGKLSAQEMSGTNGASSRSGSASPRSNTEQATESARPASGEPKSPGK
jgi:Ca2+-binding EF-hand superfamily protein